MWRNSQGPVGEVRARQLAKAFSSGEPPTCDGRGSSTLPPSTLPFAHAHGASGHFHQRASFEVADDALAHYQASRTTKKGSLLAGLDAGKRGSLPIKLDEVETYTEWQVKTLGAAAAAVAVPCPRIL